MTEKILWTNDLFCGAGGMGLGFKNAGFRLAGAWDFDKYAVESYGNNVSPKVKQADITQMKWDELPKADVWTFGFPCQDLSVAGKQAGMKLKCLDCEREFKVLKDGETNCPKCGSDNTKAASRSGLFFEVMRLLDETIENEPDRLPNIIMAENVKGLKPYLGVLKDEYNKRGYRMTYTLYNSKYWGVPQNRERYFVVGIRETIRKAFQFPRQQTDFIPKLSSVLESEVDEKYYIDDLKAAKIIEQAVNGLKVKQATKKGYDIAVEGDSINISHPNSETRRGRVGHQVAQTLLTGQEQVVVESIIVDDTQGFDGVRVYDQYSPTLRSQRQGQKVLEALGDVHACITPDRADKRQNGRRAKGNEEEMFTLTAQDLHGVIIDNKNSFGQPKVYTDDLHPTILSTHYKEPTRVIEEQPEINMLGLLDIKGKDQIRRVYDPEGISPTLTAVQGGGHEAKILDTCKVSEQATKFDGFTDVSGTLLARDYKGFGNQEMDAVIENRYRVRKLTPREYARLQGFPDSYEQVVSNSQFYKQMGNAVTVNVAQAIAEKIKEFLEKI